MGVGLSGTTNNLKHLTLAPEVEPNDFAQPTKIEIRTLKNRVILTCARRYKSRDSQYRCHMAEFGRGLLFVRRVGVPTLWFDRLWRRGVPAELAMAQTPQIPLRIRILNAPPRSTAGAVSLGGALTATRIRGCTVGWG